MIRVAVAAVSPLVRADLRRIVGGARHCELACEADTLAALRARLMREPDLHVDVVILDDRSGVSQVDPAVDLNPGGGRAGPAPTRRCSRAESLDPLLEALKAGLRLVLLADTSAARALPLVAAGATWLAAAADASQIEAAVRAAAAGLLALPPERFGELHDEVRRSAAGAERRAIERVEPLTPREVQVLERLAAGRGNRRIATELGISEHTAKFHVSRILGKLAAGTRAEAVAIGLREGLIGTT